MKSKLKSLFEATWIMSGLGIAALMTSNLLLVAWAMILLDPPPMPPKKAK
jgi:hypothetical protein